MKLSYILSMLLSASLIAVPVAYAHDDKGACMIEKQQELVQNITLDAQQQKLWQTYMHSLEAQKANFAKMKELRQEMKNTVPQNAVEAAEKRLTMREKMMVIEHEQIKHMKVSVADLKKFYASLNTQQKAEFDAAFKKAQEKRKEKMKKHKKD